MRRLFAMLFTGCFLASAPALAVMEDYPSVKLQGLDKSVGRTTTFEATVGSTIQYGSLFIKIQSCRKAPPIEKPESAAFLQIWEVPPGEEKSEWVFSGWMFASSPALSAMDNPVYDVWVLDCLGREQPNEEAKAAETKEDTDQTDLAPADPNAPAATQETVPAQEQDVPVDSEAEDPYPAEDQSEMPAPATDSEEGLPAPQAETPVDPSRDGTTAYDFMRMQKGTNAQPIAPPPASAQPTQIYTP